MTKAFSEELTPPEGSILASAIKLQQRAAERAVEIARLISENDCNNRFCTFWSASMLLTVGLNVTSFFDEERQANPAWYADMSRFLEAELLAIFHAAGWHPFMDRGWRFGLFSRSIPLVLSLSRPVHYNRGFLSQKCRQCHCECAHDAEPREVPEGVLTTAQVTEKLLARASTVADEIFASVSENDYNNKRAQSQKGIWQLYVDLTETFKREKESYPIFSGDHYDLRQAIKKKFEAAGWRVQIEHKRRDFKADRYWMNLGKPVATTSHDGEQVCTSCSCSCHGGTK